MDGHQHLVTTLLIVGLIFILFPVDSFMTQKQQIAAFSAIIIFSSFITPDLDQKVGIKHRGPTHSPTLIVAGMVILGIILYLLLNYLNLSELANYTPYFVGGAILGWILHVLEDRTTSKYGIIAWLGFILMVILAWIFAK